MIYNKDDTIFDVRPVVNIIGNYNKIAIVYDDIKDDFYAIELTNYECPNDDKRCSIDASEDLLFKYRCYLNDVRVGDTIQVISGARLVGRRGVVLERLPYTTGKHRGMPAGTYLKTTIGLLNMYDVIIVKEV